MKIYETLYLHHQEDLETLDNIDYLAGICERLNECRTAEMLRRQAIDLRTKIFVHQPINMEGALCKRQNSDLK